jgi:hypothetical protein
MVWLLLACAVAILVFAIVLAIVLGAIRFHRGLRSEEHPDDYF